MDSPWDDIAPEPPKEAPEEGAPPGHHPTLPEPTTVTHATLVPHATGAEGRIRESLHEAHLTPGLHKDAMDLLHDVATGKVQRQLMDKEGNTHTLDATPTERIQAAKAILNHGASLVPRPTHIEHANIINAGDLIANVDPERLKAAIDKRRGRVHG